MTIDADDPVITDRRLADSKNIDSELIGIVYEMALDPCFWPDLLESIGNLFEDRRSENQHPTNCLDDDIEHIQLFSTQIDKGEAQRLVTILPHLYRALKLKRDYNAADHSRGQAQAIIEQFPIGVFLVNANAELISANQHALNTFANGNIIYLKNNTLYTTVKESNQELKDLIYKAANAPLNNVRDDACDNSRNNASKQISSFKVEEQAGKQSISLLITPDPYPNNHYDRQVENCAAIFIASTSATQKVSASTLQTLFKLSKAEARLATLLASGMSLSQAAEQSYITKNTAKVQLQSIFNKTGVNRQAELVNLILTSPAVFNATDTLHEDARLRIKAKLKTHINKESHLILKDGRHLQYAEYGDPNGKPVIHIHGILGCRYERLPDDNLTKSIGVRLIIPDRPGYGLSDPALNHGYLDFADDLLELVNHLDIPQCSIMGLSVGAIYASAFAYKTPQRLHNIAMVSSTPPFRSFADFSGVPASLKLLIAFSKYLPTAAQIIAELAIKSACKDPEKFLESIPVSTSDKIIFTQPRLKQHIEECLLAGSKNCHNGFVEDILLSAQPWPFPVKNIKSKIDFWHGTNDQHSSISRIKPVIDAVPNKCVHQIEGGGHFLIYNHWQEILETLVR